jgi:hypothetical protein
LSIGVHGFAENRENRQPQVQGEGKRAWRARVRAVATSTSLSTPCVKIGFVPKLLSPKVRAQAVENLFFNSPLQTLAVPERLSCPIASPPALTGRAGGEDRLNYRLCFSSRYSTCKL